MSDQSSSDQLYRQLYRQHDPATAAQTVAARPDRSVWVSANAGSGKTRVLTNRVARLLLAGVAPSRILCLTYTKAAAAEMQIRLFKTLGAWAMAEDVALAAGVDGLLAEDEPPLTADERGAARRLFARALETPGGLKIQTIHAFCESLLSRFPLEAGVSPHFQVVDDVTAAQLLAEAQDRVILSRGEDAALDAALDQLMRDLHEAGFQDMLADVTAKRRLFEAAGPEPEAALAAAIGARVGERREGLLADWRGGLDPAVLVRLAEALETTAKSKDAAAAKSLRAAAAATRDADAFDAAFKAVLTKKGTPPQRGFPSKDFEDRNPWALEPLAQVQHGLMDLLLRLHAADRLAASTGLAVYARAVLAEYRRGKADLAGLDYDDLIEKAVALLTRSDARDWVRFKLDGGVEHVLVDEAQDTSPLQWRAIEALIEEFFSGAGAHEARDRADAPATPRTVFAVGDEKQSIYSFQGAAPELLSAMGDQIAERAAAGSGVFLRSGMATSFRSTPAVLTFADQVFAPPEAQAGLVFGGGAVAHRAFRKDQSGLVELWPLVAAERGLEPPPWDEPVDAPPPDDPRARLAELIASAVRGWIGRELLPARGRPIRAGDVLVLVRSRGPLFAQIIKRLKQKRVPVAGEDRLALNAQLVVKDLMALGRFCLFPEDDLTLAALLRSPFCDVDEAALFELAHYRKPGQPLWYALTNRQAERPEYAAAHRFLAALVRDADFARPYELYARALGPMGGRVRLVARLGAEAEDPIDEFLAQTLGFETSATPTLQAFVDWSAARDAEIKRELEQGRDQVRVMTAHGAKGLEAPVVILPDTVGPATGGRSPSLLDAKAPETPPIWVGAAETDTPAIAALREAHLAREAEEHRRLLYVALTRAEDRLLICGAPTRGREAPEGSWYALCETAMTEMGAKAASPVTDGAGARLPGWRYETGAAAASAPAAAEEAAAALAKPDWLSAVPPAESAPSDLSPSRLGGADPEHAATRILTAGSDLERGAARRRGIAVHSLLEHLADVPAAERAALAERLLDRLAPDAEAWDRRDILEEAMTALDHPACADAFDRGGRSEVPVAAVLPELGPGELHGFVDRLIVKPDRIFIVDYKTGAIPEEPPEGYLRQMGAYRLALQRIYGDGRPVSAALLWTAGPMLQPLASAALDAAVARAAAELAADAKTALEPQEP